VKILGRCGKDQFVLLAVEDEDRDIYAPQVLANIYAENNCFPTHKPDLLRSLVSPLPHELPVA
jgi:hypothetical protein